MNARRIILGLGVVVLLAALIGLFTPVSVSDGNGNSISCGNAVATDYSSANSANEKNGANIPVLNQIVPHSDYVALCRSSANTRRSWTIPLAIVGAIGIAASVLLGRRGTAASV